MDNKYTPLPDTRTENFPPLLAATIVYGLIYFPLISFVGLVGMVYDNPNLSILVKLIANLIIFIPYSIPISIILMWYSFSTKQFKLARYFTLLPIATAVVCIALAIILGYFT